MTAGAGRLALIGLGEVGQILAADLHGLGSPDLWAWDRLFPVAGSEPNRALRALSYVREAGSLAEAVSGCSVVISAVTAGECGAAAREAASALARGAFYFDLNSVSPGTRAEAARCIEAVGGCYVEAAVMSSIGPKRSASPMWLGGPHAHRFLPLARSLGFTGAAVYSDAIGDASAAKMCRSVVIKGMEALLAEALLTARRYGVEEIVLDSLNDLLPAEDWRKLARYLVSRSLQHGRRRAEEMREVTRTVAEAGLEPWMSRSCTERQQWAAEHADALRHEALTDMLDAVLARTPHVAPGVPSTPTMGVTRS
jgi:3-hydroxyisobutyrate dehydrogenase-like beta-hydroxyacid dehydrogenase